MPDKLGAGGDDIPIPSADTSPAPKNYVILKQVHGSVWLQYTAQYAETPEQAVAQVTEGNVCERGAYIAVLASEWVPITKAETDPEWDFKQEC